MIECRGLVINGRGYRQRVRWEMVKGMVLVLYDRNNGLGGRYGFGGKDLQAHLIARLRPPLGGGYGYEYGYGDWYCHGHG